MTAKSPTGILVLCLLFASLSPAGDKAKQPEILTNSIGMKFALIPLGEFLMGSPDTDKDAQPDEKPQHKVQIGQPFYCGIHTVTIGQFRAFVKETGYRTEAEKNGRAWKSISPAGEIVPGTDKTTWDNVGLKLTEEHPVVVVDYGDALAFCDWLSKKEGKKYRLPTEAEWEYACRAGTTTRWSCGDAKDALVEHGKLIWDTFPTYARINSPTAGRYLFTAPVGHYKPNAWGLYDMHGNVWQWCSDWYGEDYYKNSPRGNPTGPKEGDLRVLRGGTWSRGPLDCRSANRFALSGATSLWVGFRVVCESAPLSRAEAVELGNLQGVWINVFTEHDGVRETPDSKHVLLGNRYFVINGDKVAEEGTFQIDVTGPIKKIDFTCLKGDYAGMTWKGIYRLDGDSYRHFGPWGTDRWENRPAGFQDKTDATTWLRVMKRASSR